MSEIMKLINQYIELQKSCFSSQAVVYYLTDVSNKTVKDLLTCSNVITKIDFGVILVFENCKVLIAISHHVLDGFTLLNKESNATGFSKNLRYVLLVCEENHLCFWSHHLSRMVSNTNRLGAECILLNKIRVLEDRCYNHDYNILPIKYTVGSKARLATFNKYMLLEPFGYHTKDSDFLFKIAFNHYRISNPIDQTLVHYFERVYTDYVYGFIELPGLGLDGGKIIRNRSLYNFWFADLHAVSGCDTGVGHIERYKFYFCLACSNKEATLSGLELLRSKYEITILDYEKSPTCFVKEFMHYESESTYFNTYFIGIFNSENWVLFMDVFQRINRTLTSYMSSAEYALQTNDIYTIEEKYNLRFGYFIYAPTRVYGVEDLYKCNKILPWFSLPEWCIELEERQSKIDVLDVR